MHQSSFDKMKKFRDTYLDPIKELRILDVGSLDVNGTYAQLFSNPKWTYKGVDMTNGKNVDFVLNNAYNWNQIPQNSFDVVISGQSFEHMEYFWITMLQINRVLKVGGLTCIIAPSKGHEHRYPNDCWRYYPDGMTALAKWARMEVIEASTQWENQNYSDSSNEWGDSVLVCMKVVNTHELDEMLNMSINWIGLDKNSRLEEIKNLHRINNEEETNVIKKYSEILKNRITINKKTNPNWREAIFYLLMVYDEREDLQVAFKNLENQEDLTDLLQWAANYGINEDLRLSPYTNLYRKFVSVK